MTDLRHALMLVIAILLNSVLALLLVAFAYIASRADAGP